MNMSKAKSPHQKPNSKKEEMVGEGSFMSVIRIIDYGSRLVAVVDFLIVDFFFVS